MNPFNPFRDKCVDTIIYKAIVKEIDDAIKKIYEKYKDKIRDIKDIEEGMVGFDILGLRDKSLDYIKNDKELSLVYKNAQKRRILTKSMVKKVFKDCFNELLDETPIVVDGKVRSKRDLLAEKILNGVMTDTLDPVTLKGFEVIRDTIGEKPANEVISKGIQQKVIDVKITQEKVERVQNILESLRSKKITDGLGENRAIRTVDAGYGNERAVKVDVSGESERVYNPDVLPDKQD